MSLLRIKLIPLEYEYPTSLTIYGVWGGLEIYAIDGDTVEVLLKFAWNVDDLIEWYLDNYEAIFSVIFPYVKDNESLIQAVSRVAEQVPDFDDVENPDEVFRWGDLLYEYRSTHVITFGMSGARVPDMMIGLNHGAGEISLKLEQDSSFMKENMDNYPGYFKPGTWAYPFEVNDFKRHFKKEIFDFLSETLKMVQEPAVLERIEDLLKRLESI